MHKMKGRLNRTNTFQKNQSLHKVTDTSYLLSDSKNNGLSELFFTNN